MNSPELYLLRMELPMGGLVALARRRGLAVRELDEGQAVHCALGELFKDKAPRPFALPGHRARRRDPDRPPDRLEVHAYSRLPKAELMASADAFGAVALHDGFDQGSLRERRLPARFPEQVGFTVRLCPVARLSGSVDVTVQPPGKAVPVRIERRVRGAKKRGREVDAFEAACIAAALAGEPPVASGRRGEIYQAWFERLIGRADGVELMRSRLLAQRATHLWRRDHGAQRRSHRLCRPEIVVSGVLQITDQEKFRELLARGIGRHKAFGFGMLLLRPAGEV